MTTILTTYAEAKRDNYLQLKSDAQDNFTAASEVLAEISEDYEELVANASELDKDIAGLRQQLSSANNLPADIADINEDLRDALIVKNHLVGELANAKEDLNAINLQVAQFQQEMIGVEKALALAEEELAAAQTMEAQHTQWTSAEVEDEITTARDNATDLLADTFTPDPEDEINPAEILSAAVTRIEDDIPEVLRDRARARVTLVSNRVAASLSAKNSTLAHSLSHVSSSAGDSGLVAQRWSEFDSAHDQLKSYALTTVRNYETAISLLQNIVDSAELTITTTDAITSAALEAGDDAVTTEVTLHEARAAVDDKRMELEIAVIDAVINDINADPSDDGDVQAKETELSDLEADLVTAEGVHTEEFSTSIDIWEATVPDYIWNNLQQYDRAVELLTAVSTSAVAPLTTALTDAENALVAAMQTEDDNQRLVQYLQGSADVLSKEYDYLLSANRSLGLSALRGDF